MYPNLTESEIDIILKYQERLPILQQDNDIWINTRELHEQLEVKRQYSKWIEQQIRRVGAIKNRDYKKLWRNSKKNEECSNTTFSPNKMVALGYRLEYIVTISTAKAICDKIDNNTNTAPISLYLSLRLGKKEFIIREQPRKEYQFGHMLETITGFQWDKQYPIPNNNSGFYRLDFKLKNYMIVEYDEDRHSYDSNYIREDKKRMKYCVQWLLNNETKGHKIHVVRVKEGEELQGIHKIMMYLIKLGLYTTSELS